MPSHEQMIATVEAYVEGFAKEDSEAIARLYAQDATVEDPIGTPMRRGIGDIRAFYAKSIELRAKLTLQGAVRTVGNIAAFAFTVEIPLPSALQRIDVIDTFTFDAQGKIIEMRAFWGPQNIHLI